MHVCTFVYACALIGYICIAYLKDHLAASENQATTNPRKHIPIIDNAYIQTHMYNLYTTYNIYNTQEVFNNEKISGITLGPVTYIHTPIIVLIKTNRKNSNHMIH